MHFHLGKVFISHTSADKPFVRRLASRLKKDRFDFWLDEHDLIAGDPLPESIGKALEAAKVILVVVSKSSISSKWLLYELNIATEKMIKGECRVIPIVIDEAPLPPAVRGLLYSDCRKGLAGGITSVLTALKHESRRAEMDSSFWSRVNRLVEEIFDGRGFVSPMAYRGQDWDVVEMPIPDINGNKQNAFYDAIPDYRRGWGKPEPLEESWLAEFERGVADTQCEFALLISECPVHFKTDQRSSSFPNVAVRRLTFLQIVVVDLSGMEEEELQKGALCEAKALLMECGEYRNAKIAKSRKS